MKGDQNNTTYTLQNRFKAGAGATVQKSFKTKPQRVLESQHFSQEVVF